MKFDGLNNTSIRTDIKMLRMKLKDRKSSRRPSNYARLEKIRKAGKS